MKKLKKVIFMLLCFIFVLGFNNYVRAESSTIDNIDINVKINEDGSASITEAWNVEIYDIDQLSKSYFNLNTSEIKDLVVVNENKEKFEFISNWNNEASREEKSNKCGLYINKEDGETAICFGTGENGKHVYAFKYTITNFVKQKSNYQSLNFKFLQSHMDILPKSAKITIEADKAFKEKNIDYEGLGFDGESKIEDGKFIFNAPDGLKEEDYMEVSIDFNEDIFSIVNEDKSGDAYKNDGILSTEKSKAKSYKIWSTIIVVLILVVGLGIYYFKYIKNNVDNNKKK